MLSANITGKVCRKRGFNDQQLFIGIFTTERYFMPLLTEILMLAALPVLLVLSGFFSGSETAWFSLSRHQVLELDRAQTMVCTTVARLAHEKRSLLITLMLGNMVANVSFFVVSAVLLLSLKGHREVSAWTMAVLNLMPLFSVIMVGEVMPKLIASRYAMSWARLAALPLMLAHRGIAPVRLICAVAVIGPLARLIAPSSRPPDLSSQELASLLELSQRRGVINHEEEQMLQQVLSLSQLKVRDLMTPRVDIIGFDLDSPPDQLIGLFKDTRFSRVPIYRGDLDHIEGIVYRRQVLLRKPNTRREIKLLIRQVRYVPELQRADHLLVDLRKRGTTMAMAVDEYGGTAGLVTLEDVVEPIVGQIVGSTHGDQPPQVQKIDQDSWRVSANLSMYEWADVFGKIAPVVGVSTIGGFVMVRLGKSPVVGDRVVLGNVTMEVEKMNGQRIGSLLIRLASGRLTI